MSGSSVGNSIGSVAAVVGYNSPGSRRTTELSLSVASDGWRCGVAQSMAVRPRQSVERSSIGSRVTDS